jgi:hypothetical protein
LFLLFAPDAASVLATIVSRCQIVPLLSRSSASSNLLQYPNEDKEMQEELCSTISKYEIDPPVFDDASRSVVEAMQWASKLELAASEGMDSHFLLDWIVFKKFDQLKQTAASDSYISAYLDHLLSLAQTTKDQLDSYVQPRVAFESFALSLAGIRR